MKTPITLITGASRGRAGGAIVNVSSSSAHTRGAGLSRGHAASQGAIDTFTLGLARQVAAESTGALLDVSGGR